jgi:hypothetical protein
VLNVFVEAIRDRDPRVKNLWFDVTSVVLPVHRARESEAGLPCASVRSD